MSKEYPNICLVCRKKIKFDERGDDNIGLAPVFAGGDICIIFGYGSRFDEEIDYLDDMRIQAVICDDCFEETKDLTRKVVVCSSDKWEII